MSDYVENSVDLKKLTDSDLESLSHAELLETAKEYIVQIENAENELSKLRIYSVYGFWTKSGRLFYAGMTLDFKQRLYDHFKAIQESNNTKMREFHVMLTEELANEGVYVSKVYDKLTMFEAYDKENFLIQVVMKDPLNAGNEMGGNVTKKYLSMTKEQRKQEIGLASEKAAKTFISIDKTLLFKGRNYSVLLDHDEFSSHPVGECKQCKKERKLNGRYCSSCISKARKEMNTKAVKMTSKDAPKRKAGNDQATKPAKKKK